MQVNNWLVDGMDMLLLCLSVYLFRFYFSAFFDKKNNIVKRILGYGFFAVWQIGISQMGMLPACIKLGITIGITFLSVMLIFDGDFWSKCVFTVAFNAIWMLMETLSNYGLMIYCEQYAEDQLIGSLVSKILFCGVIIALKKFFTDEEIKELPAKYSLMLILIPTGSIYIMNEIFMLVYKANDNQIYGHSTITILILLGINVLVFFTYMKLADDLLLKRMNSVYEQQLELCERHQQETEIATLQLCDVRHNMKNNLISILAYAETGDCKKVIEYVNEIMDEGGMKNSGIINTGNIVIDSLIGYWCKRAWDSGIEFEVKANIPMQIPFKGADLCLILGNLLENSVEAAEKSEGHKYIRLQIKYDKQNLLLFIENSYKGPLLKIKENKFRSTKADAQHHGVGLASVFRTAKKYNGVITVITNVPGKFQIHGVLYGRTEIIT